MNHTFPMQNVSIATNRSFSQNIELLIELVKRDLKSKYRNVFLGVLWVILQPLLLALFFVFVGKQFIPKFEGYRIDYFSMFVVLIPWQFFASTFQRSIGSIEFNNQLIYRIKFPMILLPLSMILSSFVDLALNLVSFLLLSFFFKKIFFVSFIFLVFILLISSIFISSLCILFSILICFMGDLRHVVPYLIKLSLFGLPILYSENVIPAGFRQLYASIPPVWMILKSKEIFNVKPVFIDECTFSVLLISVISISIVYMIFKKMERFVVDYI